MIGKCATGGDIALTLRGRAAVGGLLFDRGQIDEAAAELEDLLLKPVSGGLAQPEVGALITLASIAQSGGEVEAAAACKPYAGLANCAAADDFLSQFVWISPHRART